MPHCPRNVVIVEMAIILGQAGIAGSVKIEKAVSLAQVGRDHIHIADNVVIASKSGVTKDIENQALMPAFQRCHHASSGYKWPMPGAKKPHLNPSET